MKVTRRNIEFRGKEVIKILNDAKESLKGRVDKYGDPGIIMTMNCIELSLGAMIIAEGDIDKAANVIADMYANMLQTITMLRDIQARNNARNN